MFTIKEIKGNEFLQLCKQGNKIKCMEFLETHEGFYLNYENNCETALMWACCNQMEEICIKILSYPTKCAITTTNCRGNTILMLGCQVNMESVCMEILKKLHTLPINYHMDYLCKKNNHGFTALILACAQRMESVCMEILLYPENCALNTIDRDGYTALMWACENNMEKVCMKILTYPNNCGIELANCNGLTALTYALINDMDDVCKEISKYLKK